MRKFFRLLAFSVFMLCGIMARADNITIIWVNSAPSGSCTNGQPMQYVISTGALYSCQAGTWGKIPSSSSGSVAWGNITGTLSNQTDLQTALNAKLSTAGGTMTGALITAASATGGAGLNLPPGTAPSSPNNGDCWTTSAGLYCRIGGSTVGPYGTGSGSGTVNSGTTGQIGYYAASGTAISGTTPLIVSAFAGATADVQIAACLTALGAAGGICDARSYGATTQTIAATVTIGPSSSSGWTEVLFSPTTVFKPSATTTQMFFEGPFGIIDGLTVDTTSQAAFAEPVVLMEGYEGGGTFGPQYSSILRNFTFNGNDNTTSGSAGVEITTPGATTSSQFENISNGTINGFHDGIYLYVPGTSSGDVNAVVVNNISLGQFVYGIELYGLSTYTYPALNMSGNEFVNVTSEASASTVAAVYIHGAATGNSFINQALFDAPGNTIVTASSGTSAASTGVYGNYFQGWIYPISDGAASGNAASQSNTWDCLNCAASDPTQRSLMNVISGANAYEIGGNPVFFYPDNDDTSIAAGFISLFTQASTGLYNTGVGYGTLHLATGGNNTSIGAGDLEVLSSGADNTAVGYYAGDTGTNNLTTGTLNTLIGYNTAVGGSGDTNETVIGAQASGNGSNTVTLGNSSVTKTFLQGEVTGSGHRTTQQSSGANLCGSATLSGTGWTGSSLGPYTHSSGTTALTASGCTALVAGQSYLLTYSMTAGGGGTVTSSFGGLSGSANTSSNTYTQYGTATSTTTVAFTPTTGFTGTVTLGTVVAQGPKATSCGTPVIVQGSTDYAGKLTTAVSGCVLTFQNAYTNAPACHFMADTAVTGDASQAVTNTTLTVTAVGMTAFDYECIGLNE